MSQETNENKPEAPKLPGDEKERTSTNQSRIPEDKSEPREAPEELKTPSIQQGNTFATITPAKPTHSLLVNNSLPINRPATDSTITESTPRALYSIFPETSSIKDYGYHPENPLHTGIFAKPLLYDGINVFHGDEDEEESSEEEEFGEQDETYRFYQQQFKYNPYMSPVNVQETIRNDSKKTYTDDLSADEINRKARALFDFSPENDNEVALYEGQLIWISYRHGQGWLVAEDPETGENGLVPEEYVDIFEDDDDTPTPFLPGILQAKEESESEWVDTDYEVEERDTQKDLETENDKEASITTKLNDFSI